MNINKISYTDNYPRYSSVKNNNISFESKKISPKVMQNTISVNFFKNMTIGALTLASLQKFKTIRLKNLNEQIDNYDKKIRPVELGENIEFKKAKTVEDGISFAKNVLKIKEVDKNISLDAINYVNKCIVDVSNANGGNITVPTRIAYGNENIGGKKDSSIITAYVIIDSDNDDLGTLFIEKKNFSHKFLDKSLDVDCFLEDGSKAFDIKNGEVIEACMTGDGKIIVPDTKLALLIEKYYKNPKSLTLEEKRIIHFGLNSNGKTVGDFYTIKADNYYSPIYHEMGHLQDMAKNYKKYLKEGKDSEYRWITREHLDKSFIKRNSDLRDFYSDKEQEIVSEVSDYSKKGIGEFIAETYAMLVAGEHVSTEVMALYEKYNGPKLV